jgi:hypothetical protein
MTFDDLVSKVTNPYERTARLYPVLLAFLPLFVLIILLYGPKATVMTGAISIAGSCGGLYLATDLCRELGKNLEEQLFRKWGGKPTTQLLRHRDKTIDAVTKRRYHSCLATKINHPFPNEAEEVQNPAAADETYQSGVRWLLNNTRPDGTKKFDLIFSENIGYGFRRNSLGMKPIGLVVSVGSLLWILVAARILFGPNGRAIHITALAGLSGTALTSLVVSATMLIVWGFFFTENSVRTAAFTYAETLLRACDSL